MFSKLINRIMKLAELICMLLLGMAVCIPLFLVIPIGVDRTDIQVLLYLDCNVGNSNYVLPQM